MGQAATCADMGSRFANITLGVFHDLPQWASLVISCNATGAGSMGVEVLAAHSIASLAVSVCNCVSVSLCQIASCPGGHFLCQSLELSCERGAC